MSEHAFKIHTLRSRYHLHEVDSEQLDRLHAINSQIYSDEMDSILDEIGVHPREEICIKELRVPVYIKSTHTRHRAHSKWRSALMRALKTEIDSHESSVIRYPSRLYLYLDIAESALTGDRSRIWAWKQAGFTELEENTSTHNLINSFVRRLYKQDRKLFVPIAKELAKRVRLTEFLTYLDTSQCQLLASIVASVYGISIPHTSTEKFNTNREYALRKVKKATEVLRVTRIGNHCMHNPLPLSEDKIALLTMLSIVEAGEGGSITNDDFISLFLVLKGTLASPGIRTELNALNKKNEFGESYLSDDEYQSKEMPSPSKGDKQNEDSARAEDSNATFQDSQYDAGAAIECNSVRNKDGEPTPLTGHSNGAQSKTSIMPNENNSNETDIYHHLETSIENNKVRTQYAGLFYLITLFSKNGFYKELSVNEVISQRVYGWVLFEIASRLLPHDANDPTLLVFSGFAPDDEQPNTLVSPAEENEVLELDMLAGNVLQMLSELFGDENEFDRDFHDLFTIEAEIIYEPGWIEVIYPITCINTLLRRHGLDLDPGYVEWLGAVIKFRYE